jgi:uncharacterized membrane protein
MNHPQSNKREKNVGTSERVAVGALATGLVSYGLSRLGRRRGWLAIATGVGLLPRALTGSCRVYRALGIDTSTEGRRRGIEVRRAITIARPVEEVYRFCREFENLPRFVSHVTDVQVESNDRVRWTVRLGKREFTWTTALGEDVRNERIVWRSGANEGIQAELEFVFKRAPSDLGTEVHVYGHYDASSHVSAAALAPFFRTVGRYRLGQDLHRLKQLIELGEVVTSQRRAPERERMEAERERRSAEPRYQTMEEART